MKHKLKKQVRFSFQQRTCACEHNEEIVRDVLGLDPAAPEAAAPESTARAARSMPAARAGSGSAAESTNHKRPTFSAAPRVPR